MLLFRGNALEHDYIELQSDMLMENTNQKLMK